MRNLALAFSIIFAIIAFIFCLFFFAEMQHSDCRSYIYLVFELIAVLFDLVAWLVFVVCVSDQQEARDFQ